MLCFKKYNYIDPKHAKQNQKGLTLIELLLVLVVVGIFSAIAMPSFTAVIQNNRLTAQTNDFVGAIHLARNEAITRNSNTQLCASNDGTTCDALGNYTNGWLIWTDANQNGLLDNSPLEILRIGSGLTGGNSAKLVDTAGSAIININFFSNGLSDSQGTLTLCDSRGADDASAIVISLSGRARVNETDALGAPLTC